MQGFIFVGFQKFMCDRLGEDRWRALQTSAGVRDHVYLPLQNYPGQELKALVEGASRMTGMSVPLVLESFGDFVAAEMLRLHAGIFDPSWKVLDVIVRAEEIVNAMSMRTGDTHYSTSPLTGRWGKDGEVLLTYQGELRMCSLLKGLMRGIGGTMEQPVVVDELRCMLNGAPACEIVVRLEHSHHVDRPIRKRVTPPPLSLSALRGALFADRPEPSSRAPGKNEGGTMPPPVSSLLSSRPPAPTSRPSAPPESPSPTIRPSAPPDPPTPTSDPSDRNRR